MTLKKIELEDGKYTILHHEEHGGLTALRYGEVWRNDTGDGMILAMFHEIERLQEFNSQIEAAYDDRVQDIEWLNKDIAEVSELLKDVQEKIKGSSVDLHMRIHSFIKGQELVN